MRIDYIINKLLREVSLAQIELETIDNKPKKDRK